MRMRQLGKCSLKNIRAADIKPQRSNNVRHGGYAKTRAVYKTKFDNLRDKDRIALN